MEPSPPSPTPASLLWRVALVVALLAVLVVLLLPGTEALLGWAERLRALGWRGMAPFVAVYAVACVLMLPASPFPLAAGFLYGPWVGFAVAYVGELVGATAAYAIGRRLLRGRYEQDFVERWPVLAALDDAVKEQGFVLLVLLRLSPVLPFGVLNYGLGVLGARARDYVLATAIGVVPASLALTYAGSTLPHLRAILEGDEPLGTSSLPY